MTYKIALGEVDPTTAVIVDPQPKSGGITDGVEHVAGDGSTYIDGYLQAEWHYTLLTPEQYSSLLTTFDLVSNTSRTVTLVMPRNQDRAEEQYYGRVKRPQHPSEGEFVFGYWRNVVFKFNRVRLVP